ncbi:MAG: peptide MFS transporter [Flavobacteriales bacterium]|nr:peptide MFS transporter [Flavobacteriales bacterium]
MSTARKHPRALPFLFLTEMWERFGYYLMIGIFQLYLMDPISTGGMAMERKDAADIYGTFIALVFLTPFIGGLLADRVLGYTKAIFIGGTLMGLGYIGLALPGMTTFYLSLALIIIGNGFFKPNISTLLGNLYNDDQYRAQKDSGYNIFYMGINVGACICNLFAAYMRNRYGWGYAFATAGVGMFIGLIVFFIGLRHYRHADVRKPVQKEDMSLVRIFSVVLLPAVIAGVAGWAVPGNLFGSDSTDAFIFATLPVIGFFVSLYFRAAQEDRKPIVALLSIFAVSVMFWAVFKQNGTALTTWAQYYTDRELPAAVVPIAESLYQVEKPVNAIDTVVAYDSDFKVIKVDGKEQLILGKPVYFQNMQAELLPPEGEPAYILNTELFQSVNPLWVVVLTPLVVAFFAFLRRRNMEPSTASKIGWGLLVSALSTLVMVWAVSICQNGAIKASAWWLIASYGVVTVGELMLSPMGLSLVSKVSPARLTALMMGGWFLSTSIGNKLSGILASLWDTYEDKGDFFLVNFALLMAATLIMFVMLRWLNRIIPEKK